jgi:hypothetical protein
LCCASRRISGHSKYRHRPGGELGGRWAPNFPAPQCLHNRRSGQSGRRDPGFCGMWTARIHEENG